MGERGERILDRWGWAAKNCPTFSSSTNNKYIQGLYLHIKLYVYVSCVRHIVFMFDSLIKFCLAKIPFSPGVVGTVERAQADFSLNLVLTGQREKAVDFGLAYIDDPLTFCISAPLEVAAWESIFRPFPSVHLWIIVIATFISLGQKHYTSSTMVTFISAKI